MLSLSSWQWRACDVARTTSSSRAWLSEDEEPPDGELRERSTPRSCPRSLLLHPAPCLEERDEEYGVVSAVSVVPPAVSYWASSDDMEDNFESASLHAVLALDFVILRQKSLGQCLQIRLFTITEPTIICCGFAAHEQLRLVLCE